MPNEEDYVKQAHSNDWKSSNNIHEMSYLRKSTLDETDDFLVQKSQSSWNSPEEQMMQMKILSNFKLNPFPIESDEDDNYEANYDESQFSNSASRKRMNRLYEDIQNSEANLFNIFEPFSAGDESLQNEELKHEGSSPGPIFSLLSKAD